MELEGVLLSQPWGKFGMLGLASRLFLQDSKIILDSEMPYGEFILGGDKFNETYVVTKDEYLNRFYKQLCAKDLGKTAFLNYRFEMPFTLRVLSIRKPSPLTCHPDTEHAKKCHTLNPRCYPTCGARNQILVALQDFTLLLGFRPLWYIAEVLEKVSEMKYIIDDRLKENFLKTKGQAEFLEVFKNMLDSNPLQIEFAVKLLSERLIRNPTSFHSSKLFLKLSSFYPSDVGIFMPYFLNVVKIKPRESIFITPGTPYAYLFGEALQCSNTVENSAKAAFTCKKDVDKFLEFLNWQFMSKKDINDLFVETREVDNHIIEYMTAFSSFRVFVGSISQGYQKVLPKLYTFSVLLVLKGKGCLNNDISIKSGSAFFFYANEKISVIVEENLFLVQVGVNFV